MKKNYQCHFDFQEVSGGAIITEYDEDGAPIVSVAEVDNIIPALGHILHAEINEGAEVENARVTTKISNYETIHNTRADLQADNAWV